MDNRVTDTNSYKKDALIAVTKRDELGADREKDSESNSLLPPRRGGMSKKPQKLRRKVQWNDRNGNKLVEILEFQPR